MRAGPARPELEAKGHRAFGPSGPNAADQDTHGNGHPRCAVELLRGGPDPDVLRGHQGADTIEGGDGSDLVIGSPATDGNDTVGGDAGEDALRVPTTTTDDAYEIAPDGPRVRVRGTAAEIGLNAVETIDVGTGAGTDKIVVRDLTGTPTEVVRLDLGAADLRSDTVSVEGTAGADTVDIDADSDFHDLTGLPARVLLVGAEPGDRLEVDGRDGNDTIDASGMSKDRLQPFLRGGPGKDAVIGSSGQDQITGGLGPTSRSWAVASTPSPGCPGTAATSSRAGRAPTS